MEPISIPSYVSIGLLIGKKGVAIKEANTQFSAKIFIKNNKIIVRNCTEDSYNSIKSYYTDIFNRFLPYYNYWNTPSISYENESKRPICIDALNISDYFLNNKWDLKKMFNEVKIFVEAFKRADIKIVIFIDGSTSSQECLDKWKSRRENELVNRKKSIPHGWSSILGDMFKMLDIETHYSINDCDDTIAEYAYMNKYNILSSDKDFYRYKCKDTRPFLIFNGVNYKTDEFKLLYRTKTEYVAVKGAQINLNGELLETITHHPFLISLKTNEYFRGIPTESVRDRGNPHIFFKEFRSAVFYKLGFKNDIEETFLIWNNERNEPEWVTSKNTPIENNELIDNPQKCIDDYGGILPTDSFKYVLGVKAVYYELYQLLNPNTTLYELLTKSDNTEEVTDVLEKLQI